MTNQQRIAIALVFVVAVVAGGAIAFGVLGGGQGAGASPSPVAIGSPSSVPASSPPAASVGPSDAASPSLPPSAEPTTASSPSASATPEPSPTPAPTIAAGQAATAVVTSLKLDARDDPDGANRRITFRSQGTGTISVAVRTLSPQGDAVMCLSADGERLDCKTTSGGKLTHKTRTRRTDFVLTLRGAGIETPVVEVSITFPARTPRITLTNARFDGTAYPETNGIQVLVNPRESGDVTLEASWGGHPLAYEVDLLEQGGPGAHVLANQGPSTGVTATLPVTAPMPWKLVLQNIEDGFGITPLDATITWP